MSLKHLLTLTIALTIVPLAPGKDGAENQPARNRSVIKFAKKHMGRKVGDGDCWDFGHQALLAAGGQHPGRQPLVWGTVVRWPQQAVMPGDIIQTFTKRKAPAGKHTAIIYRVHDGGEVTLAEQNFNNQLFVTKRKVNLFQLKEIRELHIYRP